MSGVEVHSRLHGMCTCSLESKVDGFKENNSLMGTRTLHVEPPEEMLEVKGLYLQNPEMDVNFAVLEEQWEAGSDSA